MARRTERQASPPFVSRGLGLRGPADRRASGSVSRALPRPGFSVSDETQSDTALLLRFLDAMRRQQAEERGSEPAPGYRSEADAAEPFVEHRGSPRSTTTVTEHEEHFVTSSAEQLTPARPWGVGRLAPYPTTVRRAHATVAIDPATQLGVFRDRAGQVVEMGKHGTSSGTETSTTTNSDSAPDQGHDQDSQQD